MHRLFVALRPPEEIIDLLIDAMEGADLRWQDEDQLHLTLRFVGVVERPVANDLAAAFARLEFPAFDLRIDGVGRFDHGRRGALWAGVTPKDAVKALAAKIERSCQAVGLEPERRAYHPHVTLARWSGGKPRLDAWLEERNTLKSAAWRVRDFVLYESHLGQGGPHYEPLATYPLN